MPLQLTPYAVIAVLASAVLLVLAFAIWRRRPGVGVVSFVILLVAVAEWSLASALELTVMSLGAKRLFAASVYFGVTTVPAAWLAFVLEYTGRERWLTRRNLLLLTIEPLLTLGFVFTNNWHHLFWTIQTLDVSGPYALMIVTHGPAFWVHAGYSYILMLVSTGFLIEAFIRSPQLYRGQVRWLLLGSFAPWIGNALFIFNLNPLPDYVDLTPLTFTITGLSVGWSLYRYQLMDIVPIARDKVVEGISDAVLVLDRDNRIVDVNPAALRLFDTVPQALIGQPIALLLSDRQDLLDAYRDVEQAKAEIRLEIDGENREYALTLSSLHNRQGNVLGRIVVLHDITELKQTNRELDAAREVAEEANLLKSQFLATMSHELRTPLNAINGFTEILLEGMAGELNERQMSNLRRVHTNARDLRKLIDDLLDLAKIEAGRTEVIKKPFAIRDWLDEILGQTRSLADEKGLRYISELDPRLPPYIVGDPGRLKQLTVNLISNAIKFTDVGEVRITVKRDGEDQWLISVSDTGIGIPPHAQEYIFDKFRQIDGQSTRKHGGSGLGLAIVRNLAMVMGGGVRVSSVVGKGSTFSVMLPLQIPADVPEATTHSSVA